MLSEGYLSKLHSWYQDGITKLHTKEVTREGKEVAGVCTLNYTSAYETGSRRVFKRYGSIEQKTPGTQGRDTTQTGMETTLLQEMEIPIYETDKSFPDSISANSQSNKEAYLVPSSCKDICRDYNDLHVAGDQVMAINSVMTDFTCETSYEFGEGPFLQSSQIPSAMDSLCVATDNMQRKLSNRNPSGWKEGSIKDKSIMNQEQPLSNSILNEYLERKVIELYKQYMMDMSSSASPTHIMASELIMNNVQQISMQLSREQNMETNKAKDMVISYLLRLASEKQSNFISTPDLQISSNLA
ncbi:TLR adapter interacting with SLC15A4 on the lysosome [Mantella aurantiaca]